MMMMMIKGSINNWTWWNGLTIGATRGSIYVSRPACSLPAARSPKAAIIDSITECWLGNYSWTVCNAATLAVTDNPSSPGTEAAWLCAAGNVSTTNGTQARSKFRYDYDCELTGQYEDVRLDVLVHDSNCLKSGRNWMWPDIHRRVRP